MLKRTALALLGLGLVCGLAWGDAAHYIQVSATATVQTVPLGGVPSITIVNRGANEIYFRLFAEGEDTIAATASATTSIYLASGASLEYSGNYYGSISIVCSAAETATVSLYTR